MKNALPNEKNPPEWSRKKKGKKTTGKKWGRRGKRKKVKNRLDPAQKKTGTPLAKDRSAKERELETHCQKPLPSLPAKSKQKSGGGGGFRRGVKHPRRSYKRPMEGPYSKPLFKKGKRKKG